MHTKIDDKIVDLAFLFKDKVKINLIDGFVDTELSETSESPVKMDTVTVGHDMVAVDTVGTMVMGINSAKAGYLKLTDERGLGISNLNKIEILGTRIEDVKKKFDIPSRSKSFENI